MVNAYRVSAGSPSTSCSTLDNRRRPMLGTSQSSQTRGVSCSTVRTGRLRAAFSLKNSFSSLAYVWQLRALVHRTRVHRANAATSAFLNCSGPGHSLKS
jgi:hypothetical protein